MIFVFGSNLSGRHGKGAALTARRFFGAKLGVGVGRTGDSYAIPTKSKQLMVLPLETIEHYVNLFISYANFNPSLEFYVTPIGTGLAGYSENQIKPMFVNCPKNCILPDGWRIN